MIIIRDPSRLTSLTFGGSLSIVIVVVHAVLTTIPVLPEISGAYRAYFAFLRDRGNIVEDELVPGSTAVFTILELLKALESSVSSKARFVTLIRITY